jgi:hypothetical protein
VFGGLPFPACPLSRKLCFLPSFRTSRLSEGNG